MPRTTSLDLKTFLTPPGRNRRRQWTPSSLVPSSSLDDDSKHRPRTRHYFRQPPDRSRSWNIRRDDESHQETSSSSSSSSSSLLLPLSISSVPSSSSSSSLYRPPRDIFKKISIPLTRLLTAGSLLQILVLAAIIILVVHCSSSADFATSTLQRLQHEESLRILQLHTIEQQSLLLHNRIRRRLHQAGIVVDKNEDDDPLESQRVQLEEMTNDLNAQVTALQHEIQKDARDKIIRTYGEGPVKVVIEFDFGSTDESVGSHSAAPYALSGRKESSISILLFPDTPYTSWVWLEQIERNLWDGSKIEWDSIAGELHVSPSHPDPLERGLLDFVEYHTGKQNDMSGSSRYAHNNKKRSREHKAWTVGLRQSILLPSDATGSRPEKRLEMFINLSNDQKIHKHETYVGTLLDGFDTLQRLLMVKRLRNEGGDISSVSIKKISAMHIAHSEFKPTNS